MHKTIFGRILISTILTVTFCMVSLSVLLFTLFGNYMIGEQKRTLREEAVRVSALTAFFQDNPEAAVGAFYYKTLEDISLRINGVVFLVNPEGKVIAASENANVHLSGTLPKALLTRLFSGEYAQLGNFSGLFPDTYLLVSSPISYHGQTPAVSCTAVPIPNIHRYRNEVFRLVLWSVLSVALLTCIISYFISRHISKPLKDISFAAKSIARGDFSVEVPVRGTGELAALSETFNQMTFSLQKLEEMRDGFIASVSHELRTPMTTISGFIEGILDGTVPKEREAEYLSIVLSETKRLSRLVNELLLVARMEGGLALKRTLLDMNEAVRRAILRFEKAFSSKNIEVNIEFDAETCPVNADRDAMDRVLTNLFDNAVKFNREGGYVRVHVSGGESPAVMVENSGAGISEEDLRMIWDKFYKTDASRSLDKTGVGLGLYLVKNIIAAHGGKITAESVEGEYTRFVFTLGKK